MLDDIGVKLKGVKEGGTDTRVSAPTALCEMMLVQRSALFYILHDISERMDNLEIQSIVHDSPPNLVQFESVYVKKILIFTISHTND